MTRQSVGLECYLELILCDTKAVVVNLPLIVMDFFKEIIRPFPQFQSYSVERVDKVG